MNSSHLELKGKFSFFFPERHLDPEAKKTKLTGWSFKNKVKNLSFFKDCFFFNYRLTFFFKVTDAVLIRMFKIKSLGEGKKK